VAVVIAAGVLFFGVTNIPWPVFIAGVTLLAWQAGGKNVAIFALSGQLFILVCGVWQPAMLSVYLCLAAVLVCLLIGGSIGIWAAHNDTVSAVIRPLNDTLQTMPLFVLLIPVLMFFQVGEFTAFLAIIAYAIVPAIRYTEHGLRQVDSETVEAARGFGCTPWQILTRVKLPLAIPEIMLGLNQTIMFALAMLVIAALVGTRGLGQAVYIALGKADPGLGVVAGFSMALIAMIADRIIQAWSAQRKSALGLA
jgi:glycine betaine/proline transport system permease protein